LAESVTDFLGRLRSSAQTLDVGERQRVLRLLVKEILVGDDKILIRHSIPLPSNPPGGRSSTPTKAPAKPAQPESYLLCTGRNDAALRRAPLPRLDLAIRGLHRRFQPAFHIQQDPRILAMLPDRPHQEVVINVIE